MASICYLLLCHKDPDRVAGLVDLLTSQGDSVVIHADRSAGAELGARVAQLARAEAVRTVPRLRCGWGTWSLVAATLSMLREGVRAFPNATHFYLISGDCFPITPAADIRAALAPADRDHIELNDFLGSGWIRTGLRSERLTYRHHFNERSQKRLFYLSLAVQKRLGLARAMPKGVRVHIGSQWWCLRRRTAKAVLALMDQRRDLARFFATTWIPDETFFQTLVGHVVPRHEITSAAPTFHLFSDYGLPVVFQSDHLDLLRAEPAFFARKLSAGAEDLRAALARLYRGEAGAETGANGHHGQGAAYFRYVTGRGRIGARFGPRLDAAAPGLRVDVIVCKKWHVGKRMAVELGQATGRQTYGYVFDEDNADLPDMGGLEGPRARRARSPLAFLAALAQVRPGPVTLCLDPQQGPLLSALVSLGVDVRVFEMTGTLTDGYLEGHGQRMGLPLDPLGKDARAALLESLRANIAEEHAALSALNLPAHQSVDAHDDPQKLARALADLFDLEAEAAYRAAHNARFNQPGSAHVRL